LYAYFMDKPLKEVPHIQVLASTAVREVLIAGSQAQLNIAHMSWVWFLRLEAIYWMQVPLHTIIEIQMGVTGMQEKRYKLMEATT